MALHDMNGKFMKNTPINRVKAFFFKIAKRFNKKLDDWISEAF